MAPPVSPGRTPEVVGPEDLDALTAVVFVVMAIGVRLGDVMNSPGISTFLFPGPDLPSLDPVHRLHPAAMGRLDIPSGLHATRCGNECAVTTKVAAPATVLHLVAAEDRLVDLVVEPERERPGR